MASATLGTNEVVLATRPVGKSNAASWKTLLTRFFRLLRYVAGDTENTLHGVGIVALTRFFLDKGDERDISALPG